MTLMILEVYFFELTYQYLKLGTLSLTHTLATLDAVMPYLAALAMRRQTILQTLLKEFPCAASNKCHTCML